MVHRLLAAGTPPNFLLGELPTADVAAMEAAGIYVADHQHSTPLMVAVRQLNADVAVELLEGGAAVRPPPWEGSSGSPRGRSPAARNRPLLLQLLDATAAAAAQAAVAAAGPTPMAAPGPAELPSSAVDPSDTASQADGAGGKPGAATTAAASAAGTAAVLDTSCRLLRALLEHGADPLEQDPTTSRQPTTFLSGE